MSDLARVQRELGRLEAMGTEEAERIAWRMRQRVALTEDAIMVGRDVTAAMLRGDMEAALVAATAGALKAAHIGAQEPPWVSGGAGCQVLGRASHGAVRGRDEGQR